MIVEFPQKLQPSGKPKSILKQLKVVVSNSIVMRVKNRRQTQAVELNSIAEQVAKHKREAANPVLDHDTGKTIVV